MSLPRLSCLELSIMEIVWSRGTSSIREIQESFPEKNDSLTLRRPVVAGITSGDWRARARSQDTLAWFKFMKSNGGG